MKTLILCLLVASFVLIGAGCSSKSSVTETPQPQGSSLRSFLDSRQRTDSPTETRDPSTGDKDCTDFTTHREAQEFFEDEGGPDEDWHNLDRDGDGIACETLP